MMTNQQRLPHLPWNHCQIHLHLPFSPCTCRSPSSFLVRSSLSKQGQQFLTSIAITDPSAADHMIRKFVASSPKSVSLCTLIHLLSPNSTYPHLSCLTLPLYIRISEAPWFSWNSKLVADVIAMMYKQGLCQEAESLTSEAVSRLGSKKRDLTLFYGNLIESAAKLKSEQGFSRAYACLKEIMSKSSSAFVTIHAQESLIRGFCIMGLPHEAEKILNEATCLGWKPSDFSFRCLVLGYGKLGMFDEMLRILSEMEISGFVADTVCANMILSAYGAKGDLQKMSHWVQKMKSSGIRLSVRTLNTVLNSCPAMTALLQDPKSCPTSKKELLEVLGDDEASLVQDLIGSSFLDQLIEWDVSKSELDLHGMHPRTAYLIMLLWMEELRSRFTSGKYKTPAEIVVICGLGKHSNVRGNSKVKSMVKELMHRTRSPMRIDRTNAGCFIAKGKVVMDWLGSSV